MSASSFPVDVRMVIERIGTSPLSFMEKPPMSGWLSWEPDWIGSRRVELSQSHSSVIELGIASEIGNPGLCFLPWFAFGSVEYLIFFLHPGIFACILFILGFSSSSRVSRQLASGTERILGRRHLP